MRGRENTKQHADVWEWSEPDVTKLSMKKKNTPKNKSCIRAELNLMAQDWHFANVPNTTLHPTKYGIKENNWAIVPASMRGTVCTVKTMQTFICLGLVAQKQDGGGNNG